MANDYLLQTGQWPQLYNFLLQSNSWYFTCIYACIFKLMVMLNKTEDKW